MSDLTRRGFLASAGTIGASALAGCVQSGSGSDTENDSATLDEPGREVSAFRAAVSNEGIRVDGTMDTEVLGVSLFYYRDADAHREQIATIATEFAKYRDIVGKGSIISVTALETTSDRHGTFHVAKDMAAKYASGDLTKEQYVTAVANTYDKR